MYEIVQMQKIENKNKYTHYSQINKRYDPGNQIREKNQLEGEVALLSFFGMEMMQVQRKRHSMWIFL
jgi:hypothetical protein